MRAYVDADILIWHLRGERKAAAFLRRLADDGSCELWTGAMQRAEVVFFMRPDEVAATELFLAQFRTAVVDQRVVDAAGALYRQWRPGHGMDMGDAFLAATAALTGGRIYTLNTKHYPMRELPVTKAW